MMEIPAAQVHVEPLRRSCSCAKIGSQSILWLMQQNEHVVLGKEVGRYAFGTGVRSCTMLHVEGQQSQLTLQCVVHATPFTNKK